MLQPNSYCDKCLLIPAVASMPTINNDNESSNEERSKSSRNAKKYDLGEKEGPYKCTPPQPM